MTDAEFLRFFAEAVGCAEGEIHLDTELRTLEGWDSVAYLSTMTFLDEQAGVAIEPDRLMEARTVSDILFYARAQS